MRRVGRRPVCSVRDALALAMRTALAVPNLITLTNGTENDICARCVGAWRSGRRMPDSRTGRLCVTRGRVRVH